MTREEAFDFDKVKEILKRDDFDNLIVDHTCEEKQELCRDMEEIREVMSCDADAETKCKMISNILTTKPHYFEKQMQEPKTGHWIVHPKGIYAHLMCDKCLSSAPYDCKTNYCPNCGAKMECEDEK